MAHRSKKSGDARERNLILVANNSEAYSEIPQMLFPRSSSRNPADLMPNSNLFQSFHDPERDMRVKG
jgi:hypothetical protein